MKKLSVIICILFGFNLAAQKFEFNYTIFSSYTDNKIVHLIPAVENQTVDIITTRQKNGKKTHYRKQFDQNGKLLKYAKIEDGKEQLYSLNTYTAEGKKENLKKYKKGKLKSENIYTWNHYGGVSSWKLLDGKGQLLKSSEWNYKGKDCVLSSKLYKGEDLKLKRQWDYEYYEGCDKKRSILRNGKGKVLKQWTYDCKEEGEILEKKKDVTQVCKWEETDDQLLTKVSQTFDERGRTIKRIYKYRLQDTAIVSIRQYDENEILEYERTFDHDINKPLMYAYYKKGKKKYGAEYQYKGELLVAYSHNWKKRKYRNEYQYNDKMMVTAMKSFNSKNELSKMTTIAYQN